MNGRRWIPSTILILSIIHYPLSTAKAQNMPHEAGFWFSTNGQVPLIKPNEVNRGFYIDPTIEHAYYSFTTNGIQSLSVFIEHVDETRPWIGTWTNQLFNGGSSNFPASVQENLFMTTLGLETMRTLLSESGFRLGAGLGLGYGLGGASANVRNISTNQTTNYNSINAWSGLFLEGFLRARYSLFVTSQYDFGIMAMGRFWGFPAMGPIGSPGSQYNGPQLRALSEFGYLAGLSVGF
jgi:hypothetical protein